MINSIADKVFVITTVDSNRTNYIKNHLIENNIKFDFFVAPETNIITSDIIVNDGGDLKNKNHKALLSLISAYVSIIEIAKISDFKIISVIEDDCYFDVDWDKKIQIVFNNLPHDWDLLNLGYHSLHETVTIKKKYNDYLNIPLNWHHTTHCMMIKNTCYDVYLKLAKDWNYTLPADYLFNEIYKNQKYKCFYPVDKFIYQLSSRNELNDSKFRSLML
jgi:hypothetical protein